MNGWCVNALPSAYIVSFVVSWFWDVQNGKLHEPWRERQQIGLPHGLCFSSYLVWLPWFTFITRLSAIWWNNPILPKLLLAMMLVMSIEGKLNKNWYQHCEVLLWKTWSCSFWEDHGRVWNDMQRTFCA